MRVSVAREVVGFVIRYQHFTLPQMKINDKIFFSYHTRNHFDFQNRMLWIHLFFSMWKIGKMSSTLNKFKDLGILGPHIQPQTTTHRPEPSRSFLLFLVTDKQSNKTLARIWGSRLSMPIDRSRASSGMRYLCLDP